MTELKTYIISVCVLCIVGSIAAMLLSDRQTSKTVGVVINLIVIICAMTPVFKEDVLQDILYDFPKTMEEYETVDTDLYYEIIKQATEKQIREDLLTILNEYSVDYQEIKIDTDISQDLSIIIKQITVVLKKDNVNEELKNELAQYHPNITIVEVENHESENE